MFDSVVTRSIDVSDVELSVNFTQDESSIQQLNIIIPQPAFELTSFEHNQIQIKLSFEDPLDVSLGEYLDMLEVKLLESYFLRI